MDETLHYAIKAVVFALMTLVGTDCTLKGLRESLKRPWLTMNVGLGQFIIVPLLMYACCYMTGVPEEVTAGLMLIACCPAGSISNTYCYLIKGNTSLSVSLTTISNLTAIVLMPIALTVVRGIASAQGSGIPIIPSAPLVRELGLMMVLPILIGASIREKRPEWISGRQKFLRQLAFVSTAALLLLIVGSAPEAIVRHLKEIVMITICSTIVLLGAGWLISLMFRLPASDRWAVLFEFPCRNLAIAAMVGITVLNRPELVRFAAALFLIQAAMLLALLWIIFKKRALIAD